MTLLNKMGLTLFFVAISSFVFNTFVTIFEARYVFMLDFGLLVWFVLSFIPTIEEIEDESTNRDIDVQEKIKALKSFCEHLEKKVGEK